VSVPQKSRDGCSSERFNEASYYCGVRTPMHRDDIEHLLRRSLRDFRSISFIACYESSKKDPYGWRAKSLGFLWCEVIWKKIPLLHRPHE
jgi:hypothetical protein